jgi:serine/threonine protein kinase
MRAGRVCPSCGYDGRPQNKAPMLPEGTPVGGRYVIGREEGRGGFSICYRAWDGKTGEIVAVKELFPAEVAARLPDGTVEINSRHRDDFEFVARSLENEAEILQQLTSEPAIVQVRDVFKDNETVYLSMEYLRGRSYQKYLDDHFETNKANIDINAAVNVVLTVLGALQAVHARKLLHLDVKPPNIRVLDKGRIVLLDFGSARDAFRIGSGLYINTFTPGFAAPEQFSATGSVTPATDVYGVAATLYYSLSRQIPPRADDRENGVELPALSTLNAAVPPALDAIIEKAMALDPHERYPEVSKLKDALEPFAATGKVAPVALRIVAGLLDIAVTLLLLSVMTAIELIDPDDILWVGPLLWLLMQAALCLRKATPGMFVMGLRLTTQLGRTIHPTALLRRTARFKPDSDGRLMHDRFSNTRLVFVTK